MDVAFEVMASEPSRALAALRDLRGRNPEFDYFFIPLEYLLNETSSEDPKRSRRAKKVLIDAIDRFSLKELGIEG
jgi:hypothetical protein